MNLFPQPLPMLDRVFLLAAATGAFTVLVRALMLCAGGDEGADLDGHDGGEGTEGFRFLSVFGHEGHAGAGPSILGGGLAGLVALVGIARLFHLASRLQSSGTLPPQAAVGCQGVVYLGIPAGGTGRVTVRIGERLREMDARHSAGTPLPTGTPIQVLRVERTLAIVQPLSPLEPS